MTTHDQFMQLATSTAKGCHAIQVTTESTALTAKIDTRLATLPVLDALKSLKELPQLDDSALVDYQPLDLPVMAIAGIAGALTSHQLRGLFAELHDHWGQTGTLEGGHKGEPIDRVPGRDAAGGFGHRWDYGHDIANYDEVDKDYYLELADKFGGPFPRKLVAYVFWLRHLLQDSFSREGLPIPFHSLLRPLFEGLSVYQRRKIVQTFLTIKARDVAGTAVTNLILQAYLMATEGAAGRSVFGSNWRTLSLRAGANLVTVFVGLTFSYPLASLNWSALTTAIASGAKLYSLSRRIEKQLQARDRVLNERADYLTQVNDAAEAYDREFRRVFGL